MIAEMEHPATELLDEYVTGVLDDVTAGRVDEHLASCDVCAGACADLAAVAAAWAAWTGQHSEALRLAAPTPAEPGARRFYVCGARPVEGALRDVRLEAGRLHFTLSVDEHATLPDAPVFEVVFLDTLDVVGVPLPPDQRKRLGRAGLPCVVDIPAVLRRRLQSGLEAVAFRIRSAASAAQ
jgi:hypothetical protein